MAAVTDPTRLRESQCALIDRHSAWPLVELTWMQTMVRRQSVLSSCRCLRYRICSSRVCEGREHRLEGLFDATGIGCRQAILGAEVPACPDCGVVTATKIVEFGEKSIA